MGERVAECVYRHIYGIGGTEVTGRTTGRTGSPASDQCRIRRGWLPWSLLFSRLFAEAFGYQGRLGR